MRYVIVEERRDGYWLDPRPYLEALPTLGDDLPQGARAFACERAHYDFASDACVKDLWFRSLALDDAAGAASLTLAANESKHAVGLRVDYAGVQSLAVDRVRDPGVGWLGSVLLDELLPDGQGVVHEIALTGGTLRIVAADAAAFWG
jgi:hypothetical protein